jgi:predicted RND superfamily exporter protein
MYFDGLMVVDKETIQNVIVACVCVFIVSLIMLGDVLAAGLVLSMIGLADICILGYMSHWNLDFNSVTAINLVLAVGLAVDYSAHIAHSFLVTTAPTGRERAMHAVEHIGISVLNGAFSTFLAIFPLCMSKSYVFIVFFKMWFMIIIFGVYFGVILLPVCLSLLSPFIGAGGSEAGGETSAAVKPEDGPADAEKIGKDNMYIAEKN